MAKHTLDHYPSNQQFPSSSQSFPSDIYLSPCPHHSSLWVVFWAYTQYSVIRFFFYVASKENPRRAWQICIDWVFLTWTIALLTISVLLKIQQRALTRVSPRRGRPWELDQLPATYRPVIITPQWPSLCPFPPPLAFYYCTTLPTIPKQQHLCFSVFPGFPTLNATQTSPSALRRPLWKPARWHSQQPCVQRRTSAAHSKWCHCPPEQTVSRALGREGEEEKE